jgi:hypothetical protein
VAYSISRCALAITFAAILITLAIVYTRRRPDSLYKFLRERLQSLCPFRVYFTEFKKQWWAITWGESIVAIVFVLWWSITVNANIVVVIAFLGLAGFMATYYVWHPYYIRLSPRLTVQRRLYLHPADTNAPGVKRMYLQIMPEAANETPILGCRGYLLRVEKWDGNRRRWEPTNLDEPLDLNWSFYGSFPRTVEPGVPRRLNVFWTDNQGRICLDVCPIPTFSLTMFNRTDTFRFDIRVMGDDCPPADMSFSVVFGDQWDGPTLEQL